MNTSTLSTLLMIVVLVLDKGGGGFAGVSITKRIKGGEFAGVSITKRIAEEINYNDSNNEINITNSSVGLYVVPTFKEGIYYTCNVRSMSSKRNLTEMYMSVSYDIDVESLKIIHDRTEKYECQDKTYLYHSEIIMKKIMRITISNNFLEELKNFSFTRFQNLRYLDVSNNHISFLESSSFYNLTHLRTIDLSSNRLTMLDLAYFGKLHKLTLFNLSSNNIGFLECSSLNMSEFYNYSYTLDLSYNKISTVDQSCKEKTYYKNITIVINDVQVTCNCSTREKTSLATVTNLGNCTCPETEIPFLKFTYFQILVIAFSSALVLFILILTPFWYVLVRKRDHQRVTPPLCSGTFCTNILQSMKKGPCTSTRGQRSSFVYIVAASKDSAVIDMFVEELETKRNMPVIFKERDEIPGYFKLELFRKWIHSCTKTVFLISSNFFYDSVCTHIFNQAKTIELAERRVIVVIIKLTDQITQIETEQMSSMLLSNSICLEYSPTKEFWDKLVEIISNTEMHVHVSNTV